jgi:hypothetical protein
MLTFTRGYKISKVGHWAWLLKLQRKWEPHPSKLVDALSISNLDEKKKWVPHIDGRIIPLSNLVSDKM